MPDATAVADKHYTSNVYLQHICIAECTRRIDLVILLILRRVILSPAVRRTTRCALPVNLVPAPSLALTLTLARNITGRWEILEAVNAGCGASLWVVGALTLLCRQRIPVEVLTSFVLAVHVSRADWHHLQAGVSWCAGRQLQARGSAWLSTQTFSVGIIWVVDRLWRTALGLCEL